MADERELQRRIDSIDGLRNIIYSMRSLAATYLHRAEEKLDGIRAYTGTVGAGIADCLAGREIDLPESSGGETAVLAIFSEQGLCGRFNEILAEEAVRVNERLGGPAFLVVGRRGRSLLARHGLRVAGALSSVSSPDDIDSVVHDAAAILLKSHEEGAFVQFHLLYARYRSPGRIEPTAERILPLDLSPWRGRAGQGELRPRLGMPRRALLRHLVDEYAFASLVRALTESLAAENGMRLTSMEGAKSNIDDTLEDLRQRARIERQNAITEELLDLVSGTEALEESGRG